MPGLRTRSRSPAAAGPTAGAQASPQLPLRQPATQPTEDTVEGASELLRAAAAKPPARKWSGDYFTFRNGPDDSSDSEDDDPGDKDEWASVDCLGRCGPTSASSSGSSCSTLSSSGRILYLQMEYCQPNTLRTAINQRVFAKSGSTELAHSVLRQILECLVFIHGHGVVHRDLKPENIFFTSDPASRKGDFF
eukprot:RCo006515